MNKNASVQEVVIERLPYLRHLGWLIRFYGDVTVLLKTGKWGHDDHITTMYYGTSTQAARAAQDMGLKVHTVYDQD